MLLASENPSNCTYRTGSVYPLFRHVPVAPVCTSCPGVFWYQGWCQHMLRDSAMTSQEGREGEMRHKGLMALQDLGSSLRQRCIAWVSKASRAQHKTCIIKPEFWLWRSGIQDVALFPERQTVTTQKARNELYFLQLGQRAYILTNEPTCVGLSLRLEENSDISGIAGAVILSCRTERDRKGQTKGRWTKLRNCIERAAHIGAKLCKLCCGDSKILWETDYKPGPGKLARCKFSTDGTFDPSWSKSVSMPKWSGLGYQDLCLEIKWRDWPKKYPT